MSDVPAATAPGDRVSSSTGTLRGVGLGLVVVIALYALLELTVQVVYRPGVSLPVAAQADSLEVPDTREARERAGLGFKDPSMALHPYLGYVFLPPEARDEPGHPGIQISEDGFLDARSMLRTRSPERYVVGVTGGSVAGQLGTWHAEHLREAFREHAAFLDVELDFVWLGMPGYHQPQQLIQLAYLLTRGGELDLLINLDGFNEVAVPAVLNAPFGAHPLYPMNWSMVALDAPDPRVRRAVGALAYLESERYERQARFERAFWSFSPIAKLFRSRDDQKLAHRIAAYGWEIQEAASDSIPWFVRGPERDHLETEPLVEECIAVWERASRQMHALCDAHGVRYLHVLQPNQYDAGSKPLSGAEKEQAFETDGPYHRVIESGYPKLREAGERLAADGIAFHDLSGIFAETDETLYVDNCCHFNGEGNRIMAGAIARAAASVAAEAAGDEG